MQITKKEYNNLPRDKRNSVEALKAITVKQPFAQWISDGIKTLEIRANPTNYRGKIIVTSNEYPKVDGYLSGAAVCVAEIVDCIKVKELKIEEWKGSLISEQDRKKYINHYAYVIKNARPIIEIPIKGNLGVWNLYISKGDLMEYPKELDFYCRNERHYFKEANLKRRAIITVYAVLASMAIIIGLIISLAKS